MLILCTTNTDLTQHNYHLTVLPVIRSADVWYSHMHRQRKGQLRFSRLRAFSPPVRRYASICSYTQDLYGMRPNFPYKM